MIKAKKKNARMSKSHPTVSGGQSARTKRENFPELKRDECT